MEVSSTSIKKIDKAFRKLKLSGIKVHKHCFKLNRKVKALPFDIFKCPRLIFSVFNIQAFESQYQIVPYKPQDE